MNDQNVENDARELERLRAWKQEAMTLFDGLQDLGRALSIPLGVLVTGPVAVEAANHLRAMLDDERAAKKVAADAADRFRDVLSECLGHEDENPGDDVLVAELRRHFGRTGPEPTRWRDFCTGALAVVDQMNADRVAPPALGTPQNPVDGSTHPCPTPGYAGRHTAVGAGAISSPYVCHGCQTWFVIPPAKGADEEAGRS